MPAEPHPHHVAAQSYVRTRGGRQEPSALACQLHQHLVAVCPRCREHWEALAAGQSRVYRALLSVRAAPEVSPPAPAPELDPRHLPGVSAEAARNVERLDRYRERKRRAVRDLWELRRTPPHRRRAKVLAANVRFASRMLAELLLAASRDTAPDEPAEAESLAALAPDVLRRIPGAAGTPWAAALLALAAARRADALRRLGDPAASEKGFITARRRLAELGVHDPGVLAEVASLEASLALEQQRPAEAEELLDRAALLYRQAGDEAGGAVVELQQARLLQSAGRFAEALSRAEQATARLDGELDPELLLDGIALRVVCLCALDRADDAQRLLHRHEALFADSPRPTSGATLRGLEGRVALALGDPARAAAAFADTRDALLSLGRGSEAAVAVIDLAEILLQSRKPGELATLGAGLGRRFASSNAAPQTVAALQELTRAAADRAVTRELLRRLRRQIERKSPPPPAAS